MNTQTEVGVVVDTINQHFYTQCVLVADGLWKVIIHRTHCHWHWVVERGVVGIVVQDRSLGDTVVTDRRGMTFVTGHEDAELHTLSGGRASILLNFETFVHG
ncbi:hypothetical protein D3C84_990420 [compost metagenome]